MKILVIDDHESFREMLTSWLRKEGHDVCDVDGGPETMDVLEGYDFDVITLDLVMCRANGSTLLSRIRSAYPEASIIVISAVVDVRVTVELIRSGADACLTKPVDFEILRCELDRFQSMAVRESLIAIPSLRCDLRIPNNICN